MLEDYFTKIKIRISNEEEWLETFTRSSFFLSRTQYKKTLKSQLDKNDKFSKLLKLGIEGLPFLGAVVNPFLLVLNIPLIDDVVTKLLASKIINIKYYNASGKLSQELSNQYEFRSHWKENKDISSKDSYYLVHYENDSKEKVYLGMLKSVTDLQKYKFDE